VTTTVSKTKQGSSRRNWTYTHATDNSVKLQDPTKDFIPATLGSPKCQKPDDPRLHFSYTGN